MLVFQKQTNSPNSNDLATSINKTFRTSANFDNNKKSTCIDHFLPRFCHFLVSIIFHHHLHLAPRKVFGTKCQPFGGCPGFSVYENTIMMS